MIYTLRHPFEHKGQTYTTINLPDAAKLKQQVASLRIGQVAAEKNAGLKVDLDALDEALPGPDVFRMLEINLESEMAMIAAFCEELPSEAIGELSVEDAEKLKIHINRLMPRENKIDEAEPAKKSILPRPSA